MQYDNCIKPISTLHQGCIGSRAGRIAQGATIPSFSAIEALASGFLLGEVIHQNSGSGRHQQPQSKRPFEAIFGRSFDMLLTCSVSMELLLQRAANHARGR